MSHDNEEQKNLDYATGGDSVLDVHDSVRREKGMPEASNLPISIETFLVAAGVIILAALQFGWHTEWGSLTSIYKTASYTPEERPPSAIGGEEEDTGPWIDTWLADGKKVYSNCIACHQASGMGAPGQFPPLVDVDYVYAGTDRLAALLLHGINGPLTVKGNTYNQQMPAWSILGDDKIAQVMTYIRTEFGGLTPEDALVTAEMVKNGRAKYADRSGFWTESELLQLDPEAPLEGAAVDLQTGKPLADGASDAAPAEG